MDRLSVPGALSSLGQIRQYVLAAARAAELDHRKAYRLSLAVDEIATNIVVHGYAEAGRNGTIDVWADMDEQALSISLEDTGVAFDPHQNPRPDDLALPLEQRRTGWLGIYLAIDGVDQLLYQRIGDRNRNTFIVNRTGAGALAQG
ncbi:MAG: ATP-binding protein [Chloroflexota bacterium]|nr:ATP-binding protein [Chloroflexota bacterium]